MKKRLFILLQYMLPQHRLSRWAGHLANANVPPRLLQPFLKWFVQKMNVDMTIAEHNNLNHYKNFNAFFTRHLKAGARPIEDAVVSPVDGTISECGDIEDDQILQVKGKYYPLSMLLKNVELTEQFRHGKFMTIYLAPRDYHRIHMPVAGTLLRACYIPGRLFSVNPTTVSSIDHVFAVNERLICEFDTEQGPMVVIFVGAMLVAGIGTAWQGKIDPTPGGPIQEWDYHDTELFFEKGAEIGYFDFGSTVICLFPANSINWLPHMKPLQSLKMGQTIATFTE